MEDWKKLRNCNSANQLWASGCAITLTDLPGVFFSQGSVSPSTPIYDFSIIIMIEIQLLTSFVGLLLVVTSFKACTSDLLYASGDRACCYF